MDRTSEAKKEVEKIFASALKTKLSTNQKKSKKRIQKQGKKVASKSVQQVSIDDKQTENQKGRGQPVVRPLGGEVVSSTSNIGTSCPIPLSEIPIPPRNGPTKQRRASRLQAGLTSKRGCQCNFVAKQLYMDKGLCEIQYQEINHFNKAG